MYKKILVPLDGSELAECVLPHVEAVAKGCGTQSVIFIRVLEPFHMVIGGWGTASLGDSEINRINAQNKADAENYLARLVKRVKYYGAIAQSEVLIATGRSAWHIVEYATKNSIDLITIATHGRSGVSRWVWGSVADEILRSSCVPVMMIRAPGCGLLAK
ncbi:MAG: hypothetical protein A2144_05510 [Chloroflexi bacterium RBG_16_50_9]|nr:MAG: hypothetical protein A2144_05510 [Chloroflexi bacterium RBG_16_50_9]